MRMSAMTSQSLAKIPEAHKVSTKDRPSQRKKERGYQRLKNAKHSWMAKTKQPVICGFPPWRKMAQKTIVRSETSGYITPEKVITNIMASHPGQYKTEPMADIKLLSTGSATSKTVDLSWKKLLPFWRNTEKNASTRS